MLTLLEREVDMFTIIISYLLLKLGDKGGGLKVLLVIAMYVDYQSFHYLYSLMVHTNTAGNYGF